MDFKAIQQDMVKWRRDLHQIPELGNDLPQTVAYVSAVLDELGISYRKLVDGNAIVATIDGAKAGKCFALRADMDALPIVEQTGLPFSATGQNMHACGHDAHTAMLLGAAKYLADHRTDFKGTVKLLFQPGEEYPGGAKPMIDDGALQNPQVDAVFGLHNGRLSNEVPVGSVGFKRGEMMAAPDHIFIKVVGQGTHGAYPEQGKDPIVIASELVLALQRLISREKKATEPAVLSICRISGGYNHNVIPSEVELEGTIRTTSPELRNYYKERVEKICQHYAVMHDITIEADYNFGYPPLVNDDVITELAIATATELFGETSVYEMTEPVMGGEDMAYFINAVPGTYAFLANPASVDGVCYPHHHPKFDVDESCFEKGAKLHAAIAMAYLNQ